jgi:hypothetical protein
MGGYYLQLMALPNDPRKQFKKRVWSDDEAFFRAVKCLLELKDEEGRLKKNIYYRVSRIFQERNGVENLIEFEDGKIRCSPGEIIAIELDTYNPNLGSSGYVEESKAILDVSCTEPTIQLLSTSMIMLSKFGRHIIKIKVPAKDEVLSGDFVIRRAVEGPRVPEVRLPFISKPEEI